MQRWYVGYANNEQSAFAAGQEPTAKSFPQFNAVVGPFRTKRAAQWAATQRNNPHYQCVADAERIIARLELAPWPKSKAGCERQINALLRSYMRDFAGGGAFGWDWPTFRANSPERYERVRALQKLYVELPFRDGTRLPR